MQTDEATLRSWNFLDTYRSNYQELLDLAITVYLITQSLLGSQPDKSDCEDLYWKTLYQTAFYKGVVQKKNHLPPLLYEAMAQMLARYVLNQNWVSISSVPSI